MVGNRDRGVVSLRPHLSQAPGAARGGQEVVSSPVLSTRSALRGQCRGTIKGPPFDNRILYGVVCALAAVACVARDNAVNAPARRKTLSNRHRLTGGAPLPQYVRIYKPGSMIDSAETEDRRQASLQTTVVKKRGEKEEVAENPVPFLLPIHPGEFEGEWGILLYLQREGGLTYGNGSHGAPRAR